MELRNWFKNYDKQYGIAAGVGSPAQPAGGT